MIHSKAATNKKGSEMTKWYLRGNVIWVNYYVDNIRKQKSTKLSNTPKNIDIVTNIIIPKLNEKIASGEIYKKKSKTFRYYADIFLRQKEHLVSYKSKLPKWNRVIDHFQDRNIDEITRLELKEFLHSLNIKTASKGAFKNCINSVFELAVDDDVIRFNPALNIKLSADKKEAIEYFTKEEVRKIISSSDGIIKAYLLIAFNTGMRVGEILGLQLGDFQDGFISIKRTRTKGVIGSGKTWNSTRTIPCPSFLIDVVKNIQKDNIFIFGDIDDAGKLDYMWRDVKKLANVSNYRLYATRHTFATLMMQDNIVSINELAGLLGHASAKTTLDKYASVIDAKLVKISPEFDLFCDVAVTLEKKEGDEALERGVMGDS